MAANSDSNSLANFKRKNSSDSLDEIEEFDANIRDRDSSIIVDSSKSIRRRRKHKKRRKLTSHIHEFFVRSGNVYICKMCQNDEENGKMPKHRKVYSCAVSGSTGNLWRHISCVNHFCNICDLDLSIGAREEFMSKTSKNLPEYIPEKPIDPGNFEISVDLRAFAKREAAKTLLTVLPDAIICAYGGILFMISNGISLNFLTEKTEKNMYSMMLREGVTIPDPKTLKKWLRLYSHIQQQIFIEEMKDSSVSVGMDCWKLPKCHNQRYDSCSEVFGAIASTIDEDFNLRQGVLALHTIEDQTASTLKQQIISATSQLDSVEIVAGLTNNVPNMCKACSELDFVWGVCATHTLNLCFKNSSVVIPEIKRLWKKVERVQRFVSGIGKEDFINISRKYGKDSVMIHKPSVTRWWTQLAMAEGILKNLNEIKETIENLSIEDEDGESENESKSSLCLCDSEILLLCCLCVILTPLREAGRIMEMTSSSTVSCVPALVFHQICDLKAMLAEPIDLSKDMWKNGIQKINQDSRILDLFDTSNEKVSTIVENYIRELLANLYRQFIRGEYGCTVKSITKRVYLNQMSKMTMNKQRLKITLQ